MRKRAIILIVDDEISNIEIMSAALEDDYEISFATSGQEALETARAVQPDLILLDVLMPGMDGYDVCRQIKADLLLADTPVIFSTALGEQRSEILGLELGAIDYITKPVSAPILQVRVRNHLEMKRMRDDLAELAVTDALTGLGNRRMLEKTLAQAAERLSRQGANLSVILVDIDFFKQFNDAYGHTVGDRCIVMVAATLNRAVQRAASLAARYGGEEFACVLPDTTHDEAMAAAQRIRDQVRALGIPHSQSGVAPYVTVSVGVATAPCLAGYDTQRWVKAADSQLYRAKLGGRNNVQGRLFDAAELEAA